LSQEISIQFTRFSAFYSPLIATLAGGYLQQEGLEPKHSVSPPGKSAIAGLLDGSVHVAQSAPSQGFGPLEQGKTPPALHFAQVNEKDGFFLVGRAAEPGFAWDRLKGRRVLVDHGQQPMAMFKYACHKRGLDFKSIVAVDAGSPEKMIAAFKQRDIRQCVMVGQIAPSNLHSLRPDLRALALCRQVGDRVNLNWLLHDLGNIEMRCGNFHRAAELAEECTQIAQVLEHGQGVFQGLFLLAMVRMNQGEYDESMALLGRALIVARKIMAIGHVAWCLMNMAGAELKLRRPARAATLAGAIRAHFDRERNAFQEELERYERQAREALGDDAYEHAVSVGRLMSEEEAIAFALEA